MLWSLWKRALPHSCSKSCFPPQWEYETQPYIPSLSPLAKPISLTLYDITQVKPLLNVARQEEEMKAKEEELRNAMSKTQELLTKVKDMEEKVATLSQEKNDLKIQLQAVRGALREGQELGLWQLSRPRGLP